jgi:intracellular multiplication protein IcmJ
MELLPLKLFIKPGNWKHYSERLNSKNYSKIKDIILERDHSKCCFCGYQSSANELINVNNNYADNSKNNIALACSLCAPCVLLDGFGTDPNFSGLIVFLPEIQQIELNHMLRTIYAGMEKQVSYKTRLADVMITIEERKDYVEQLFGKKSYQVEYFAQGLMDTFIDEKKLDHPVFKSLRLIPERAKLKKEIPEFIETYFKTIS